MTEATLQMTIGMRSSEEDSALIPAVETEASNGRNAAEGNVAEADATAPNVAATVRETIPVEPDGSHSVGSSTPYESGADFDNDGFLPLNKAETTVIGLSEDDSRLLLETLRQAWSMQSSLQESITNAERNGLLRQKDQKKTVIAAIIAPVALVVGLLVIFVGFKYGGSDGHLIVSAICEIVALSAMIYGLISLTRIHRIDRAAETGESYIDYCKNKDLQISGIIAPLETIIPKDLRTNAFADSVLSDIKQQKMDFNSAFRSHCDLRVISHDPDVGHAEIVGAYSKLSKISDNKYNIENNTHDSGAIVFVRIPLLTPLIGVALAVILCVTGVSNTKVYLGGHDEYPSYVIQNVLTRTYRDCSKYAEYYPASSIMTANSTLVYNAPRQFILAMFTVPSDYSDNAEKNGELAACLYKELGGSASIDSDAALDFFNRFALADVKLRSDGFNISDKRGRSCYISDNKVTIAGYSMGLTGSLFITIGLGTRTPNPDLTKSGEDINDKLRIGSLSELDKELPSLNTIADNKQNDDKQSSEQSDNGQNDTGVNNGDQGTSSSVSVDSDFTDLWNSVVEGRDMTKLTGTYCRNDGNCVSLNANLSYTPSSYGESFPGGLSFVSGDSNPLPNGDAQSDLGFQYQSDPGLPSTKMPIQMMAGCQGSAGCSEGSKVSVYYLMTGTDLDFFQQEYVSIPTDSSNPPDLSRDYLVIADSDGPAISNDTVYYRE
ncbi:hypothetical protein [Bifidobacterium miconisargentati]|uniref:hypothetical protein n=1 Tax=Bifidobacterium miconisargentati TaxID=2834437 RepID=UPI001BDCC087|nr:hypothetical protein [Bifidobacterium miconisargentati]MBW3089621.1 hypothetical protein [Bifidobacterium miconisargentati]